MAFAGNRFALAGRQGVFWTSHFIEGSLVEMVPNRVGAACVSATVGAMLKMRIGETIDEELANQVEELLRPVCNAAFGNLKEPPFQTDRDDPKIWAATSTEHLKRKRRRDR